MVSFPIYSTALSTTSAVSQELNVVASASIVDAASQPQPKGSSIARNNGHRVISIAASTSPPSSSTHSLSNNDCLDPLSSKNYFLSYSKSSKVRMTIFSNFSLFGETIFGGIVKTIKDRQKFCT